MDPEPTPGTPASSTPATGTSPAEAPLPPRQLGVVAAVAVVTVVVDQLSKHWAINALDDGRIIDVLWTLRFNLHFNTGVAFSLGSQDGIGPWVALLAIGVVIGISLGTTSRYRLGAVAAGLITGGAIGNLIDRAFRGDAGFLHGGVVDFIDLQWWPVFNVADAAVVVGAILLVIASFRVPAR